MGGKVLDGPITIRGDLIVTGRLNKGLDTAQANNGKALQVIQGVLQPVVTQPNVVPVSSDIRMYGQNTTINGNVVPGGTDGYFQIDEYINGLWQHLFEIQPSTTGNANVLDLFISGRLFARDSLLSAPGRFFFKCSSVGYPFGTSQIFCTAYGGGYFVAATYDGKVAMSSDGQNWGSLISNPFVGTFILNFAYGNGVFVAVGSSGKIAILSYSGTWSFGSLISNPFGSSNIYALAYGGGVFVAATSDGKIARSTDYGSTWGSLISSPITGTLSIAYGNGIFIALGSFGKTSRSTDGGVTWQSLVSAIYPNASYFIGFGNGVFIAFGDAGSISRSIDGGVTWSALISNPFGSSIICAMAFSSGIFVAGTRDGKVARSLDLGLTWGIKYKDSATVTVLTTYIYSIGTNGLGQFIIGGYDSSGISIAYSDYVEAGAGIVESGSNSNGSWIKFADGTMKCWGTSASAITNMVAALAGTYFASITVTLPMSFVANPIVQANPNQVAGFGWSGHTGIATNYINLLLLSMSNTYTTTVNWQAIGRWK